MERLKKLLENYNGSTYNLCYEILSNYGDNDSIFEFVCKNYQGKPENGDVPVGHYLSESEVNDLEYTYGETVNGLLNGAIKQCNAGIVNSNDFYINLWNLYSLNFTSIKEKAFAFYYTIIDVTIPYYYLGQTVSMSNERFQSILESNKPIVQKVMYIKKSNYNQHTERAALLLNCLNEIDDFETKVVILAFAIKTFTRDNTNDSFDIKDLIRRIEQKITELEIDNATSTDENQAL